MEGKINSKGQLQILRAASFEEQFCPFAPLDNNGKVRPCGDRCPLLGSPQMAVRNIIEKGQVIDSEICPDETMLNICQNRTLYFDKFTDERVDNADRKTT
jgi:hypothetical protein